MHISRPLLAMALARALVVQSQAEAVVPDAPDPNAYSLDGIEFCPVTEDPPPAKIPNRNPYGKLR